jgi:hypothetical protein
LLLGFSGGVLYTLHDAWTYTTVLKRQVQSLWQLIEQPAAINLLLFPALFGGMFLSAWQRGSLRLRWRRIQTWPRHLIGVTLLLMRLLTGKTLKVICTNDICRTEN